MTGEERTELIEDLRALFALLRTGGWLDGSEPRDVGPGAHEEEAS
jgi:hypothetical protein